MKMATQTLKHTQLLEVVNIAEFIFAGKATFTLENRETGKHYTFKVNQKIKDSGIRENLWFFSVLSGTNNESDYTYIGYTRSLSATSIFTKAGSVFNDNCPSVKGLNWLLTRLQYSIKNNKPFPDFAAFYHAGNCGRCGRKLTTPDSVASGFGPVCIAL